MLKTIFALALVLSTFSVIQSDNGKDVTKDVVDSKIEPNKMSENGSEAKDIEENDLIEIVNNCNKTFIIEMEYLKALNASGSLPDESDRTSKCFIRCVLETSGVASLGGVYNPSRAAELLALERKADSVKDLEEMAKGCSDRKETCKCEKAYQFLKCILETEIKTTEEE